MDFLVSIENFDGPMDLLLHLVKETKLDIYDIKMSEIIDKYLNYIHTLQELNIDISSSFLLMAATLIHLKSKKLIGQTKDEEALDEFSIESEEELKQRILEYEQYKKVTSNLRSMEEKRQEVYTKLPENLQDLVKKFEPINEEGVTPMDLVKALEMIQDRQHYKEPVQTKITKKEISVASRRVWIRKILETHDKCEFTQMFEYPSKDCIIATFLAILEMSKESLIKITQDNSFEQIWIWRL